MDRSSESEASLGIRVDKWLWAARFFKTRALAQQAVEMGRVKLGGERIKPARTVRPGDRLEIRAGDTDYEVWVRAIDDRRGPATTARTLYEETPASLLNRQLKAEARRLAAEPSKHLRGRPTKQDRRRLQAWLGE